jgi:hypothetical protein
MHFPSSASPSHSFSIDPDDVTWKDKFTNTDCDDDATTVVAAACEVQISETIKRDSKGGTFKIQNVASKKFLDVAMNQNGRNKLIGIGLSQHVS